MANTSIAAAKEFNTLLAQATSHDPDVWCSVPGKAARAGAPAPVLRKIYETLKSNDRADLGALGHLLTAGMPYTPDEAEHWVQVYPALAHTLSVTSEYHSQNMCRLLRMAGVPMQRWTPSALTVRTLDPADL